MTPDEINRAIAESVGWIVREEWQNCMIRPDGRKIFFNPLSDEDPLPNYHGDLNAIHGAVAESFTSNESLDAFAENLAVVIFGSYPDALLRYSDAAMMVNATAPQRCEAYLKTIGKWRDQ
jgi:hypothetical protein